MTAHRAPRRKRRWLRWVAALIALGAVSVGAVLAWLTVNPRTNPADHVDALVVLATQPGAHDDARRLAGEDVTDLLLVSSPPDHQFSLCQGSSVVDAEVVCFTPEPATTQGEAIVGTQLARVHGADSLGVLTFDHHIERSRLLFSRCWDGDLHMYEFTPDRSLQGRAYDFTYAMAAYGKAFLTPGCDTELPQWARVPLEVFK